MTIYHNHHIIPRHAGGTNEKDNLVCLTVEEHAEAHRKLFEEHGRWQDELAWKALSGMIDREEIIKESMNRGQRNGGLITGKVNAKSGHMKRISKLVNHHEIGRKGVKTCRKNKLNCFFNKDLHTKSASLGGKTQGFQNSINGHISELSKKNIGSKWITDGVKNRKLYSNWNIPKGWKFGRAPSKVIALCIS